MRKEALYWERAGESVRCLLCPRACLVEEGGFGFCGSRRAEGGRLYAATYARVSALNLDPIEKKPLSRFFPGSRILSAGSFGCNLDCLFCQNAAISCVRGKTALETASSQAREITPEALSSLADQSGNLGIAFTYNEPLVGFEYVLDSARLLKSRFGQSKKTVLVSNGFVNESPLAVLLPYIDAANFDLKGDAAFYRDLCRAEGAPRAVLRSIELAVQAGCHVEVTFLAIDGRNTAPACVEGVIDFLAGLDAGIPLHISRYFPRRALRDPPTSIETLYRLRDLSISRLKHVYLGNC